MFEKLKMLFGVRDHAMLARAAYEQQLVATEKLTASERAKFDAGVEQTLVFLRRVLASEIGRTDRCEFEHSLLLQRTRLRRLPGNLVVDGDLMLDACQRFCGFTGDELAVKGNLVIGGPCQETRWIGDSEQAKEHGQRVADFLTRPSVESQAPFSQWPRKLTVEGDLVLVNCRQLTALPEEFSVGRDIRIVNCGLETLPDGLEVHGKLTLDNCPIERLPDALVVKELEIRNLPIRELPSGLRTCSRIVVKCCPEIKTIATDCVYDSLTVLRSGLEKIQEDSCRASSIVLRDCPISIVEIPIECRRLNILNCENLIEIRKANKEGSLDWLAISNCSVLSKLPIGLALGGLRLSNLPALQRLPEDLHCCSAIEIGGTELEGVERDQMRNLQFRYQGVPVPAHAFFEPEKITIEEILGSRNAEVRRMMLQRMGVDRFIGQAEELVVDQDCDSGGKRLMICFDRRFGASSMYLMCSCPSTARVYLMQVPDSVRTCRAAAAWLAGFDNPDDYQPLIET